MALNHFHILLGLIGVVAGQTCESPFEPVGGKCLYVNFTAGDSFTWNSARTFCQAFTGVNADLASFPTCEQYEQFTRYMALYDPKEKNVWMGATTVFSATDWEWVTMEPLQTGVPFWYYLEDYHGRKGCAAATTSYYYRLYSDDCSQKKGVACTYTPTESTTVGTSEKNSKPVDEGSCPGDGVKLGDYCYCFHPVAKTFEQAQEGCRDEYFIYGGELYYPEDCEEFARLAHHAEAAEVARSYWVGAVDVKGDSEWTWVNGDPVPFEYPYWATGHPRVHNPPAPNKYCAVMNPKQRYYLFDELCSDVHNYICKIKKV